MLEIEIIESNIIDGGVEVFARAWRDGKQIGFGKDGSVDIERFRIFNPPVLVDDPNGDITRGVRDVDTGEAPRIITLREDPEEAIIQSLEHTIKLVGKDGSNIILNKIGNTTDTYYATTDDGYIYVYGAGTYSGARDASTGTVDTSYSLDANIAHNSKIGSAYYVNRAQFPFDTASIGSDSISSAALSIWSVSSGGNDGDTDSVVLLNHTANGNINNPLVSEDFNDFTSTSVGSETFANIINKNSYVSITLSDTSVVNKSGITLLGLRSLHDINNSTPTGQNNLRTRMADYSGTSNDPKLVIEHSAGGGGATANNSARRQHFMMM